MTMMPASAVAVLAVAPRRPPGGLACPLRRREPQVARGDPKPQHHPRMTSGWPEGCSGSQPPFLSSTLAGQMTIFSSRPPPGHPPREAEWKGCSQGSPPARHEVPEGGVEHSLVRCEHG